MMPVFYMATQWLGVLVYYNIDQGKDIPDVQINEIVYHGASVIEIDLSNIDS